MCAAHVHVHVCRVMNECGNVYVLAKDREGDGEGESEGGRGEGREGKGEGRGER